MADALGPDAVPDTPYDIALINFYDGDACMGMHRDADERADAPVVSAESRRHLRFRLGNSEDPRQAVHRRRAPRSSAPVRLAWPSARLAYHGVPRVRPGTAPWPWLGLGRTVEHHPCG
ncbi:alpha-ketoglutarate-dependent dioxygenase AlkB [Streptomyces tricolor]|nr:alpha-ketoglutarate-dependent dioxygenase AlkB [Streptomyces tricolor]